MTEQSCKGEWITGAACDRPQEMTFHYCHPHNGWAVEVCRECGRKAWEKLANFGNGQANVSIEPIRERQSH